MSETTNPELKYSIIVDDSGTSSYINRLLIGTPTTGLVRVEWMAARYGQVIPVNWSVSNMMEWLSSYMPQRYQVADAQNLIVKKAIEDKFQWLLLIEHDNILPPDAFIRFNEYMISAECPVVSGLYYTRARPCEPVLFKDPGVGSFRDFKMGDQVWAWGVPTGALLISVALLKAMWDESPEYVINGRITRRVFESPRKLWVDPETEELVIESATSDLDWCDRVIKGDYIRKAGWNKFADEHDPAHPFLCDTNIFVKHINQDGKQFP